jgi:hypothetical protein
MYNRKPTKMFIFIYLFNVIIGQNNLHIPQRKSNKVDKHTNTQINTNQIVPTTTVKSSLLMIPHSLDHTDVYYHQQLSIPLLQRNEQQNKKQGGGGKAQELTFICFAKTLEWKHICQADRYIRPWYRNDLSRAHE